MKDSGEPHKPPADHHPATQTDGKHIVASNIVRDQQAEARTETHQAPGDAKGSSAHGDSSAATNGSTTNRDAPAQLAALLEGTNRLKVPTDAKPGEQLAAYVNPVEAGVATGIGGALIGSIFPVIGTEIGAGVGVVLGVGGAVAHNIAEGVSSGITKIGEAVNPPIPTPPPEKK